MKGYGGAPDIWEDTKKYLSDEIAQMDEYSTVHIVPFQDKVYPALSFEHKNYKWAAINSQLDDYIKKITNTNICAAWDEGVNLFDPNKDNYLILLTDGEDNIAGVDAICKRILDWCGKYKNSFGFYVMLTPSAKNQKIEDAVKACPKLFIVDAKEHLGPFGALATQEIVVNRLDLKQRPVSVSVMGEFNASLSSSDEFYDAELVDGKIKDGKGLVKVTPRKSAQEIKTALDGLSEHTFMAKLQAEGMQLLDDELLIRVINDPERLLEIPYESTVHLSKADYHPAFLISKEKEPEAIPFTMAMDFNEDAQKSQSAVTWEVTDSEGNNDFAIAVNGQEMKDRRFTITAPMKTADLQILFDKNAHTGKRYLKVRPVETHQLERINSLHPDDFELTLQTTYRTYMNPLLKGLIISLIILAGLLLLWFIVLKRLFFPTFKVSAFTVTNPYYSMRRLRGCRKLVCTKKVTKQPFINRLFTGRIAYEINPFWTTDWVILPKDRTSIKPQGAKEYLFDPYTVNLKKGENYTVTNLTTDDKLELLIN